MLRYRLLAKPQGVTLIELLLCMSIVLIVFALLLPSILNARAQANKLSCQAKMRQIGFALHHYHHDYKSLPQGHTPDTKLERLPNIGWCARILPYIEEDKLWDQTEIAYKSNRSFLRIPPHRVSLSVVSAFLCPSEEHDRNTLGLPGFTHYLGVSGTNYNTHDGLLLSASKGISFSDIPDGLSNTIVVSERPPSIDGVWGWWYAGWGQNKNGSGDMILGVREINSYSQPTCMNCEKGPYHFSRSGMNCDFLHFWSQHNGGANFLFSDGSVRFLSYGADQIIQALATRKGGESVQWDD